MTEQLLRTIQEKQAAGTLRPNELDDSGLSILHRAAFDGQLLCVKCLVSYSGDISLRSKEGFATAHYAAAGGHLPILQYLYERDKSSVELKNDIGITPLYIAAQEGQLDCLIWLNKYTSAIKLTVGVKKMNAALIAAQEGRLDCLRYLMRVERSLVKSSDDDGFNVLHYAAIEGHVRMTQWLINHCNINGEVQSYFGQTALHLAAVGGHSNAIEVLLKCDVSLTNMDNHGKTPLEYAAHSKECYDLLQKKMASIFEDSDDNSEKKVRFDETIQTYDTFPNHHHATLLESKNSRRKERSGIFWDADLQAEFDSWRNSPKMSKHRKKLQLTNPARLHKGRSLILRKFLARLTNDTPTLPLTSSANSSINSSYERPDLLKNLNDTGFSSLENSPLPSPLDTTPPPVPARNSVRKLVKHKRPKITETNIQHSLRRYHSIDIGQAIYDMESESSSSFTSNNASVTTPQDTSSNEDKNSIYANIVKARPEPPTPPIRKNSANSRKKLRQIENTTNIQNIDGRGDRPAEDYPDGTLSTTQQTYLGVNNVSPTNSNPSTPPTRLNNPNSKTSNNSTNLALHVGGITNANHTAPMIRPRYKSMMNDEDIPLNYHPTSYLAQSGSFKASTNQPAKSLSTTDLTQISRSRQPSFTNYLQEINQHTDNRQQEGVELNNTLFTRKKKKLPSAILRGVTSFFNSVRHKEKEDPYEHLFEPSTTEQKPLTLKPMMGKERKSIFNNFTLPRKTTNKDLDELFDSIPVEGLYTPRATGGLTQPPLSGSVSRQGSTTKNIGFNNKLVDQSLRGTNQYIRDIENQQSELIERNNRESESLHQLNDADERSPLPLGRIKDTSQTRQERVNAFIW